MYQLTPKREIVYTHRTCLVGVRSLGAAVSKVVEAKTHTPVYKMHKYFARRPWNVFSELISHYTSPGEIVLDPFCGGGVTVIESLKLRRRVIGVDVNPLAAYVTEMECRPLNLEHFREAFSWLSRESEEEISSLYLTQCKTCESKAITDWIEWNERDSKPTQVKYNCPKCGVTRQKKPNQADLRLATEIDNQFDELVAERALWFPKTPIPNGDKTSSLLSQGMKFFHDLFTKRNLLALSILLNSINRVDDAESRDFLKFAFSGSLKWASRQSHLRGDIVEGWAMHAYWVYPKSLEINVWNTFERRVEAIVRGKSYSNHHIQDFCELAQNFNDLTDTASCLLLTGSAAKLPLPDECVDAIVTDPPYGGNVNYAELSDYWHIWLSGGETIEKNSEIVINRTQNKSLQEYENLLDAVLRDCYRVLKPERYFVSTFNSKDLRVVASFVIAASRAGFQLHPNGVVYQKPIRPYTTTFHAMQVGAFVGDFVFTFVKRQTSDPPLPLRAAEQELDGLKDKISTLFNERFGDAVTEPEIRERAYEILIPFLAKYARVQITVCREAVEFFEGEMSRREAYFRDLRRRVIETRKTLFR